MARTQTGIHGFDDLVEGGFPEESIILVAGSPGTGKTIFGMEYIVKGATQFNDKGMIVSFEQPREQLIEQAGQFGWDLEALEHQGSLIIQAMSLNTIKLDLINEVVNTAKHEGVRRLVIDSITSLTVNVPYFEMMRDYQAQTKGYTLPVSADVMMRRYIYAVCETLRQAKISTLLLSEATHDNEKVVTRDTVSEFACDGIVHLILDSMGTAFPRSLIIRKMRNTNNRDNAFSLEISKHGLKLHAIE
jgi:KaiC/GvpD/RAD55 family RecA-like ATPase